MKSRIHRWFGSYDHLSRSEREFAWTFLSVLVILAALVSLLFYLTPTTDLT